MFYTNTIVMTDYTTLLADKQFTRKELSDLMGGDTQHGIVNAKKTETVLLMTGSKQYDDMIVGDRIFYQGAGKKGDQVMNRLNNNLTLAETMNNNKRVFLFKMEGRTVKLISEVKLVHYDYTFDENENRYKYIFELVLVD